MLADVAAEVIAALRDLGRLERVDEALATAYLGLAREIDAADTKDRAGLYREFRAYDQAIRSLGGEEVDDGLGELIAQLSTEVGSQPPPRPAH